MLISRSLTYAAVLLGGSVAQAQTYTPTHVAHTLPGWQCMSLASVYGPQGTYAPPVPVFFGPQPDAPQVGTGAGVIIVPMPLHPVNGRTEMIWPNGQRVWIAANLLAPWHSLSDPNASCHPALLSNGRYGFTTNE